jgi:hypothetical protein
VLVQPVTLVLKALQEQLVQQEISVLKVVPA